MGYSLDGAATQTITGNTTLNGLSYGTHTIVVSATDMAGTQGESQPFTFKIETQEQQPESTPSETEAHPAIPFQTALSIAAILFVVVVLIGLLVYFRKRKQ
jgi:hypothetical protein